jgi:hypothetical protein
MFYVKDFLAENQGKKRPKGTITDIMEVGKNILEVIEEKRLRWFGHVKRMPGNRLPLKILNGNQREREEGEDPKRDG